MELTNRYNVDGMTSLAVDAERTKKPKLPKKRLLKKINRR
jgi:hypothetical protein